MARAKKARNNPPTEYEILKGLKIHIDNVIKIPPNIMWAVSSKFAVNGFANIIIIAANVISPLPTWGNFIFFVISNPPIKFFGNKKILGKAKNALPRTNIFSNNPRCHLDLRQKAVHLAGYKHILGN